jgi:fibro-slime domain-containing protein
MLAHSALLTVVALLMVAGCQTDVTPRAASPTTETRGRDGGGLLPTADATVAPVDQRRDVPVGEASAPVPVVCGDGVLAESESCDDGNTKGGDGCSADCQSIEEGFVCPQPGKQCVPAQVCGDKKISGTENCDDGNSADGDGCSAQCRAEKGWTCPNPGAGCVAAKCGDGIVAGGESCDDGNSKGGDGCSAQCALEMASPTERDGWLCATPGKACVRTVCGNGKVEGSEQCDDGNNDSGDGCTPACRKEPSCPGTGGACTSICGDGMILPNDTDQECDDGNSVKGDGCSSDCKIEPGYKCESQAVTPKGTMILPVVYRDFKGGTDDSTGEHPDFEHDDGRYEVGIVESQLGSNGKPVHVKKDMVTTTNNDTPSTPDWFSIWFKDATGDWPKKGSPRFNYTFVDTMTLTETGSNTGVFRYSSNKFFPIDNKQPSFGETPGESHNYHFTSEVRYWFQYSGNELLTFSGDDDVWVFVNKKLAVDLGGVHTSVQGSVQLHATDGTGSVCQDAAPRCSEPIVVALGLEKGEVYEIVVFQAERHTVESNYILTLSSFSSPRSACSPVCGDAIVTRNEACDLGRDKNTGEYGTCTDRCTLPSYCGDGKVDTANGEQCDDGLNLSSYGYNGKPACGPGCKWTHTCGDGKVDSLFGEQCDDGNRTSGDGCEANCTHLASCGNGALDSGEECDDGNTISNDGCTEFCTKQTIVY